MDLPWWGWGLIALWCLPALYAAVALLLQKPIGGLDDNGERYKPVPLYRKLIAFPLVLVLLIGLWPWLFWSEYRHSRSESP
jgi:hypothetical protein